MFIRKHYLNKILPFIDKPVIKVITGMRRVGKSTFLEILKNDLLKKGISQKNIVSINKESLEFDFIVDYQDLNHFIKSRYDSIQGKKYLFIDEIQEINAWEKTLVSLFREGKTDIYITGSNAHLYSSELATLLSGRYISFPIYPLCFQEFLQFRNVNPQKADLDTEFSLFLKFGGLPGIHVLDLNEEVIYHYLNSIFNTVLLKDVVTRHRIRDVSQLENITRFVFDNCGQIISSKRISDYLKSQRIRITVDTVQNYLNYLKSAFLIFENGRYDLKGKRHLELYKKYYMGEIGMRHGFIGYRRDDISGLLENVIFLDLLRRGYKISIGKFEDKEIDFIAEKEGERFYFQVCYLLASQETEVREFLPLERINDNYPKIVLSMDKDWGKNRNGILRKNIIEFLLED